MKDEKGNILNDKEILKTALDHMAESLCFLFETESTECQALAFMVDSAIKLGTTILNNGDILSASANWEKYEQELYAKHCKMKVIK